MLRCCSADETADGEFILGGRYSLDRSTRLGEGGFVDGVFFGRSRSGAACAIKVTDDHVRHEREVHTLQLLQDSRYVQQLLDYSQDGDGSPSAWPPDSEKHYVVQELGQMSLSHFLSQSTVWPLGSAAEICADLLCGLAYVHSLGMAHCDVKPANLVLSRTGSWTLIDMDSCRPLHSSMSQYERWELTDRYCPPEIARRLLNEATSLSRLGAARDEDERLKVAKSILAEQQTGDVLVTAALDLWSAGATLAEVVSTRAGYSLHSPYFDETYDAASSPLAAEVAAYESDPVSESMELGGQATQGDHLMRRKAKKQTGAAAMMVGQSQSQPPMTTASEVSVQASAQAAEEKASATAAEAAADAEAAEEQPAPLGEFEREEAGGPRDRFFHGWLEERGGAVALPESCVDGALALLEALLDSDPVRRGSRSTAELLEGLPFLRGRRKYSAAKKNGGGSGSGVGQRRGGRWYGVTGCTCDGCGLPVYDLRHACVECESFDLCSACYATNQRADEETKHPHEFDASRDVSAYVWHETEEAAEAARRGSADTAAETAAAGTEREGEARNKRQRRLGVLRWTGCARVTPVAPEEVTL